MDHVTEDILHWPRQAVEALQLRRLEETLALCARGHPAYRKVLGKAGLDPAAGGRLRSLADLARLPLTTKEQFLADPERYRLDLPDLPDEERLVAQVLYTTGSSTGVPAPIYETASDRIGYVVRARRRAAMIGLAPGNLVLSLFPLTPLPMGAYVRSAIEAAACGAAMVVANPGQPSFPGGPQRRLDEVVALAGTHRVDVVWGIAGFVRRFLDRVAESGATMPSLTTAMVTGERSSSGLLAEIASAMAAVGGAGRRVVNRYGSTEQGSSMVECTPGSGFHDLAPDAVCTEVVDPATGAPLPDGEEGALAITHLGRRGTVLLRYVVGDRVAISREPCPACGRTGSLRIVAGPYRTGDVRKVKGTLVNLAALYDQVVAVDGVADLQVVVDREQDQDRLVLRLALDVGADRHVVDSALQRASGFAGVTPEVEVVERSDLDPGSGAGGKQARVVDRRDDR